MAALLCALLLAVRPHAQSADTTAAPPDAPAVAPRDSVRHRAAPAWPAPPEGRLVAFAPAPTAALTAAEALAEHPGAFRFALGAPGLDAGVSLDGLPASYLVATLDGRPLDDLLTGAPRLDLLPAEALGPMRLADTRLGAPLALDAQARTFRFGVPVTELRYLAGQERVQAIGGTHAQTRRAPRVLRGGSDDARLTASLHVGSRAAGVAALRHTHTLARALLTRPGLAAELGSHYTDLAQRPATSAFTRRTLRHDFWASVRAPMFASVPAHATLSWVTQRSVATRVGVDTLRVHTQRLAVGLAQPFRAGRHALRARLDGRLDLAPTRGADLLRAPGARARATATVQDSLTLGRTRLAVEGGAHLDGTLVPVGAVRAERGAFHAALRATGAPEGMVARQGLAGWIAVGANEPAERVWLAEMGASRTGAAWALGARLLAHQRTDARVLVVRAAGAAVEVASEALQYAGATLTAGWRPGAVRGLYAAADATAGGVLNPGASDLHRWQDGALPRLHGSGRFGLRADAVGDTPLSVDLAVTVRAWTALRSAVAEPATGLLALADPAARADTGGNAALGLDLRAAFGRQAMLVLRYDNALAGRLGDGGALLPGEALPPHALRFGVFWALLD